MTPLEIRQRVHANPALRSLAEIGADNEIGNRMAEQAPKPLQVDFKFLRRTFGPRRAAAILKALRAVTGQDRDAVTELANDLRADGVDFNEHPDLAVLLAMGCNAAEMTQLRSEATESKPIHANLISEALSPWRPEGKCGPVPAQP